VGPNQAATVGPNQAAIPSLACLVIAFAFDQPAVAILGLFYVALSLISLARNAYVREVANGNSSERNGS
jgi:hypothetical protein